MEIEEHYSGDEVLGFGSMWFRRSMPKFRRNMLSPYSGLKWQGRDVDGLYNTWGAKAEGQDF
jgi:hypothetical protein